MLDINQPRMLHPTSSPSYLGPSPLHDMLALHDSKLSSGHLYVRQPHAIIQLVEGPPPSPRHITSVVESSSAHSSYPSSSDSEEECSSYCSSVMTPNESTKDCRPVPYSDDSFHSRMKRVCEWRDTFLSASTAATGSSCAPPLKRKLNSSYQTDHDNNSLHVSKRSSFTRDSSRSNEYLCSACDAPFPTRQSLQQHGRMPQVSEACRIAVDYNFE
ncbi:hypothetical protein V8B97DRAFT_1994646 [Scleroderma yunnanense]